MVEDAPPDCQTCGACCDGAYSHLPVEDDEDVPGPVLARVRLTVLGLMMPFDEGRCFAFERVEGQSRCTIYEQRPRVCRAFAAGSEDCLAIRRARDARARARDTED